MQNGSVEIQNGPGSINVRKWQWRFCNNGNKLSWWCGKKDKRCPICGM